MHVELVDLFRCPVAHASSWLVAAAHRTERRVILDGVLGCPVCNAEYLIVDGVTSFGGERSQGEPSPPATDDAFRLAALLSLDAPHRTIALVGYDASVARAIQDIVPSRVAVFADKPLTPVDYGDEPMAVIRGTQYVPVADNSLDGIACANGEIVTHAVARLRANGRLVAPAHVPVPDGVEILARDNRQWVAARKVVASPLVTLKRQSSVE